nr:hypothetical protein CFP56_34783 [Quercus suber]
MPSVVEIRFCGRTRRVTLGSTHAIGRFGNMIATTTNHSVSVRSCRYAVLSLEALTIERSTTLSFIARKPTRHHLEAG